MPRAPAPLIVVGLVLALVVAGGAAAYNADKLYLTGKESLLVAAAETHPSGGLAAVAVQVRALDGAPLAGVPVTVRAGDAAPVTITTGPDGFARPDVPLPTATGSVPLVVEARGERVERTLTLRDSRLVLVSSDKPLYQPGQTIHLRALVFEGAPLKALASPVTFTIRDSDGNLVLKENATSDENGVATADYPLSDQLPLGTYRIGASSGARSVEQTVRVDRYQLPRFELAATGLKSYYLPNERVAGAMTALTSFGKPVQGTGTVTFRVYEGVWREETKSGPLDAEGRFPFEFQAPAFAVGLPGEGGHGLIEVRYAAEDASGHAENESRVVPLANDPLDLKAIADRNVPGTNSTWTLVVTRPDGSPVGGAAASARLLSGHSTEATTDARGLATVTFPFSIADTQLDVTVTKDGASVTRNFALQADLGIKVLASARHARIGDEVSFTVHYGGSSLTRDVYYEIDANGRTVDVGRATLENGRATVTVPIAANMAPLLAFRAYKVEDDFSTVSDRAVVGVERDGGLTVGVEPRPGTVAPGDDVEVGFLVLGPDGKPVPGAILGVSAVDRSVGEAASRYLAALQAALKGVEADMATPHYQIHEYVYSNSTVVPMLAPGVVTTGDFGGAEATLRVQETGETYATQAVIVKTKVLFGYWVTVLLVLGAGVVAGLAYVGGRIFHARKGFAVTGAFLILAMSGLTWVVVEAPARSRSMESGAGWDGDAAIDDAWAVGGVDQFVLIDQREEAAVEKNVAADRLRFAQPRLVAGAAEPEAAAFLTSGKTDFAADVSGAAAALEEARRFFPETWAWEPALVVGEDGRATIRLVAPDRITTWDVNVAAHTRDAEFGLGLGNVTVFKSFFVDPDLPVSAVRADEFPLRVTISNYEDKAKTVEMHLQNETWFDALSPLAVRVDVPAQGVARADFLVRPTKVGTWNVSIAAKDGEKWDAVVRPLRVEPDGKRDPVFSAGELVDSASQSFGVSLAADRIPGSENAWVKIQGGREAVLVDGAESFIQFVSGCGEQSLSLLNVNLLAYRNLQQARAGALPAEKMIQYETIITQGLAHELQYVQSDPQHGGRGIVWFPEDERPHPWLTAWGLITFDDARRAGFTVDEALFRDMQQWLREEQAPEGRWTMTQGEFNNPRLAGVDAAGTAYVARAMMRSGVPATDPAVANALSYVRGEISRHTDDAYVVAITLAALAEAGDKGPTAQSLATTLAAMAKEKNGTVYWQGDQTPIAQKAGDRFSGGYGPFVIETTAYAAMALDKMGARGDLVERAVSYLLTERRGGSFFGTQDTAVALTAINEAGEDGPVDATVVVKVNGAPVWTKRVDASNRDVTHLVDLRAHLADGAVVTVDSTGTGRVRWTALVEQYVPWRVVDRPPELLLDVAYDATQVKVGGALTATLHMRYQGEAAKARMVLVTLVAPVGFAFRADELAALEAADAIDMFEVAGREATLYVAELERDRDVFITYHLDATMPVKATLQGVQAFDMYDPDVVAETPPTRVVAE